MVQRETMSSHARVNWLITFFVFSGGIIAAITGIQSLFHSTGGFQGGRNPVFGSRISFGQRDWNDLHTWGGVLMIIAVVVHFVYHWSWVVMMTKRMAKGVLRRGTRMSLGNKINVFVDVLLGTSFLVIMISGAYFLFAPLRESRGVANPAWGPGFGATTWELIHTWSGVILIVTIVVHIALHWRWIVNVTRRFFRSLLPQFRRQAGVETNTV